MRAILLPLAHIRSSIQIINYLCDFIYFNLFPFFPFQRASFSSSESFGLELLPSLVHIIYMCLFCNSWCTMKSHFDSFRFASILSFDYSSAQFSAETKEWTNNNKKLCKPVTVTTIKNSRTPRHFAGSESFFSCAAAFVVFFCLRLLHISVSATIRIFLLLLYECYMNIGTICKTYARDECKKWEMKWAQQRRKKHQENAAKKRKQFFLVCIKEEVEGFRKEREQKKRHTMHIWFY